jgi:hypothetical protein
MAFWARGKLTSTGACKTFSQIDIFPAIIRNALTWLSISIEEVL